MKDKRIGVLLGGLGPERDVSLRTGEAIANALRRLGYDAQEVFVDRDIDQVLRQTPIDVAFALHGPYGEDGCIQGLLDFDGHPVHGQRRARERARLRQACRRRCSACTTCRPRPYYVRRPEIDDLRSRFTDRSGSPPS
ncbi:MAG: hypothetical protein R3B99_33335 [Polyangiales bacterium]